MAKSIRASAFIFALAIVTCLTLLSRAAESSFFFFLLYPGNVLSLFITGGHGGTLAQDRIAPVVGFLVNTFFYYLLCAAVLAMSGHTRAKGAS